MTNFTNSPKCKLYRFEWNHLLNRFDTSNPQIPNSELAKAEILKMVKHLEKNSGVRSYSPFLFYSLFLVGVIFSYTISFSLIQSGLIATGGLLLIFGPFLSYFVFVGYMLIAGTQTERASNFFREKKKKLDKKLEPYGFSIWASFSESNFDFMKEIEFLTEKKDRSLKIGLKK